ncbi:alpha/beta hydrolase family protein [Pollutibacter soli]|uniref:alpha/beta hydrolase family protein n=1 Tax=Pollutibacter soli TaxID=3034157 RepID=UPI003013938C
MATHIKKSFSFSVLLFFSLLISTFCKAQSGSIVLKDLEWDPDSPAGATELFVPSDNSLLAGFIYRANGAQKHPTLLLLHGYPGNERNLDLAQVVRSHGWNVIYFDYRGSWGSQGRFSFENCVEDVVNTVAFCKKYSDSLKIDTTNIVLFGHSMGAWVALKALSALPGVKKGFALSTWDIYREMKNIPEKQLKAMVSNPRSGMSYFVLNTPVEEIFTPVIANPSRYNLIHPALAEKQIIMLDEHQENKILADQMRSANHIYFDYKVWPTDHSFTNKRVSLMNLVLQFLDR